MEPLLEVDDLKVRFSTPEGVVRAVNGVGFRVRPGEILGVVGESGSGKSQVFLSVMGLLSSNGAATGSVRFQGSEILNIPPKALNKVRGRQLAMVFQDPMTSLNPYLKIGRQMSEVLMVHGGAKRGEARRRSAAMLEKVGIPDAFRRMDMYPHQFSGGMRQRIMIAMALLCDPQLLIADEPTTALDVTLQAQIVDLLGALGRSPAGSLVMITHDLGVVAGLTDRVLVMYGGRIVETGPTDDIFYDPVHPYTRGLLDSIPRIDAQPTGSLDTIPGQPPDPQRLPEGCAFGDRCPLRAPVCLCEAPPFVPLGEERGAACHKA